MILRLLCLFFISAFVSHKVVAHEFYLSITQIEYNPESKSLEVAINLTGHDLEYVLEKSGAPKMNLGSTELEHKDADNYIQKYLLKMVAFYINDSLYEYSFIGKEVHKDDNVWLYIEVLHVDKPDIITMKNAVLSDYFPKQQNHVHVKCFQSSSTTVFMNGNFKGVIFQTNKK